MSNLDLEISYSAVSGKNIPSSKTIKSVRTILKKDPSAAKAKKKLTQLTKNDLVYVSKVFYPENKGFDQSFEKLGKNDLLNFLIKSHRLDAKQKKALGKNKKEIISNLSRNVKKVGKITTKAKKTRILKAAEKGVVIKPKTLRPKKLKPKKVEKKPKRKEIEIDMSIVDKMMKQEAEDNFVTSDGKFELTHYEPHFAGHSSLVVRYHSDLKSLEEDEIITQFQKDINENMKEITKQFRYSLLLPDSDLYSVTYFVFMILNTFNGETRHITLTGEDVKKDFLETYKLLKKGEFQRANGTKSDSVPKGSVLDLSEFQIKYKKGVLNTKKKYGNKIYHVSDYFNLDLLINYDKNTNNCVRIVLSQMFKDQPESEYVEEDGKFKLSVIKEKNLENIKCLQEFLKTEGFDFMFVDDYFRPTFKACKCLGLVKTKMFLDRTKKIYDAEMLKFEIKLDAKWVLYLNKNHIALTDTRIVHFYIDDDTGIQYKNFGGVLYKVCQKKIEQYWKTPDVVVEKKKILKASLEKHLAMQDPDFIKEVYSKKDKLLFRYIFFDFEGVVDFKTNSVTRAYSCSYLTVTTEKTIDAFIDYDLKKVKQWESKRRLGVVYKRFLLGYDCASILADEIIKCKTPNTFTYLIGFNSQNYDNFIIYNALKEKVSDRLSIPFYSGSSMLNFSYAGRTRCFDVCRFTQGRLADICNSFKINMQKLHVNHFIPQHLYDISPEHLINELKKNKVLEDYNNRDVEVLIPLCAKLDKSFKEIIKEGANVFDKKKRRQSILDFLTLPGFVYHIQKSHMGKMKKKPKTIFQSCKRNVETTEKYYDLFMKYKTGGRVQLFGSKPVKHEKCESVDIKSSYPNVMLTGDYYYPVGDFKEIANNKVDLFLAKKPKGIYFLQCDIDESKLKYKILCKKGEFVNDWEHDGKHKDVFISKYEKEKLEKLGAKLTNFKNCIYYKDTILGTDLFTPLVDFMLKKGEQDNFKSSKIDSEKSKYNGAMREMCKLVLNSLSGKFIEKLHLNKFFEMTESEYYLMETELQTTNANIITFNKQNGKAIVETVGNKINNLGSISFCQIGFLIYVYSKYYLYEQFADLEPIYCDTDSIKCKTSNFLKWEAKNKRKTIPHNNKIEALVPQYKTEKFVNGSLFGAYENENGQHSRTKINYFLDKKMYLTVFNDGKTKMTFKGVGKNDRPLLSYLKNKDSTKIKVLVDKSKLFLLEKNIIDSEKTFELMNEEIDYSKIEYVEQEFELLSIGADKLNMIYSISKPLGEMCEEVFEKLYQTGEHYFLTNSFRRSIKNTVKHNDFKNKESQNRKFNNIICGVSVKKIVVKNHANRIKIDGEKNKEVVSRISNKEEIVTALKKVKKIDLFCIGKKNDLIHNCRLLIPNRTEKDFFGIETDMIYLTGSNNIPVFIYEAVYREEGTKRIKYYRCYILQMVELHADITEKWNELMKDFKPNGTDFNCFDHYDMVNVFRELMPFIEKKIKSKYFKRNIITFVEKRNYCDKLLTQCFKNIDACAEKNRFWPPCVSLNFFGECESLSANEY